MMTFSAERRAEMFIKVFEEAATDYWLSRPPPISLSYRDDLQVVFPYYSVRLLPDQQKTLVTTGDIVFDPNEEDPHAVLAQLAAFFDLQEEMLIAMMKQADLCRTDWEPD